MIGSTIVFIPELPQDRSDLFERIVENEEFEKIELDYLTSLDFAIITGETKTRWNSENNPIVYDEDNGLVICHIAKAGLISVIEFKGELENIDRETQVSDIQKLKAFAKKNGFDNLFELITF